MPRYCDRCLKTLTFEDTYLTILGSGVIITPKGLDTAYYMKKKNPLGINLSNNVFYITSTGENHHTDICSDCLTEIILFCKGKQ